MNKRQIVNIVNFIRGVEPRNAADLVTPVREQIALMKHHGLRGTFLLQYDALIRPEYTEMLRALDPAQFELGIWLEMNRPHAEDADVPWRGQYDWDWHAHCGFSVGYTKEEKIRLADAIFRKFREVFGYYPRVLGSWFFDSPMIRYISDTYGLDALCNCKEQYGTDGYTLWGGYYGQGYYPSRENVFMPAQTGDAQLPVPLLRMLGSDPVYQYDFGLDADAGANPCQRVITLEPVYLGEGGGGDPRWVDWYLRENFSGECLSFGYTQAGQENSFGWPGMKEGLTYQFAEFARLQAEGKLTAEPLGDTGRWFKRTFCCTPASAITAHGAWDDPEKHSVWYCSRFYRLNLYADHGALRIRDLHLFDERHPDPYEDTVCEGNTAAYETLPVIDGNRHSGSGVLAGIYPEEPDGTPICAESLDFTEGDGIAAVTAGRLRFTMSDDALTVTGEGEFVLKTRRGRTDDHMPEILSLDGRSLTLRYAGTVYTLHLQRGTFADADIIRSENGCILLRFS